METNVIIKKNTSPPTKFSLMVQNIFEDKYINERGTKNVGSIIAENFARMNAAQTLWKREAFKDILLHFESEKCYTVLKEEKYIEVLANIAGFANKFVRPIEEWNKESFVAEDQLTDFIKHCFAMYEVPSFLEATFFSSNKIYMYWYIQIGKGTSILKLSAFPVSFTKKMAHAFSQTTANYTVENAIRRAQAIGFGANEKMAETIAFSELMLTFENETFWNQIIQFLAKQEDVSFVQVQEVLFYLKENFYRDTTFSMKGRTWNAIASKAEEWNKDYIKKLEANNRAQWKKSTFNSFVKTVVDGDIKTIFIIKELLTSEELYNEGYEMNHCVAEYEYDCIEQTAAIFSMRKWIDENESFEATIQVSPEAKMIVQAKARFNENVSKEAYEIMVEWANKEELSIDEDEVYYENADNHLHDIYEEAPYVPRYQEVAFVPNRNQTTNDIDYRWIFFLLFILLKACVLFSK